MGIAWRKERLQRLSFGYDDPQRAQTALAGLLRKISPQMHAFSAASALHADFGEQTSADCSPAQNKLVDQLQRCAQGEVVDFDDVPLDMQGATEFQRRIIHYCRRIARGKVMTYGELAAEAGFAGAARAVGSVMAKNRFPLIVPCHRVVRSNGGLGGFSAPTGVSMKKTLLAMEKAFPEDALPARL